VLIRNLVSAPITEEIVFRGLLVPLMVAGYSSIRYDDGDHVYSPLPVILRSPIWFGVAHLHHIAEKLRSGERVIVAVLSTVVQLTYTSIFGAIAASLFKYSCANSKSRLLQFLGTAEH
jgi:prenyl protein peptidase